MYCGTCLRSRFQKTFLEGIVAVVSFDYVTREVSIELVPEDEVFDEWTCVRCGRPIHLKDMQKALDRKVESWYGAKDLCILT
ncbi:MAG: hypothetical protein E4H14_10335 [Candidatus Thorarchaeota archaeon]|nr:MAG: hypothetical protein E4H14_10335 [Candidatus Thorarchaeota archaeon]